MAQDFFAENSRALGTIFTVATFGGILAAITGRAMLRKWLLNGTEDNIKEIKEMLLERIENACPVAYANKTPLSREDHKEICDNNTKLALGKHELLVSEVRHLRDGQEEVKEDVKQILRKVGG